MKILSSEQALLVSGGDADTPSTSSGGEDSTGSSENATDGGGSGDAGASNPVTVCGSVSGAGMTGEVCVTGDPKDTEKNLVDIYEGAVGATSHLIERIASAFAY